VNSHLAVFVCTSGLDFVNEKVVCIDLGRKHMVNNKNSGKVQTEIEEDKLK
jgi:hypothetical protein